MSGLASARAYVLERELELGLGPLELSLWADFWLGWRRSALPSIGLAASVCRAARAAAPHMLTCLPSPSSLLSSPPPLCRENREAMDKIVEVLLEKESMTGDEFRELLSQYATIPQEHLDAVARQKAPDAELQLA